MSEILLFPKKERKNIQQEDRDREFEERIKRILAGMDRINTLMFDLRKMGNSKLDEEKEN